MSTCWLVDVPKNPVPDKELVPAAVVAAFHAGVTTGVCHVAAVELVAVSTCPADGAAADLMSTTVVAVLNLSVVTVFVALSMILLVSVWAAEFSVTLEDSRASFMVPESLA